MLKPRPGRNPQTNRGPAAVGKQQRSGPMTYPAPIGGLVTNYDVTNEQLGVCAVVKNMYPTLTGLKVRGGYSQHGLTDDDKDIESLFTYRSGTTQTMFAATETSIYDMTSPTPPPVATADEVSTLTSGDWVATQFTNAGTSVLTIANGSDTVRQFDGASWSVPVITFPDATTTDDLNFVFSWGKRLWFIKNSTMDLYYLDVNAIQGAAALFPIGSVFRRGGNLLLGFTWSTDAGDGLDDKFVVVSTEGEVAVYGGTDPDAAETFFLEQVYQIGKPLGKNATMKYGGDVFIATSEGLIPMSQIVVQNRNALGLYSVSRPIEEEWRMAAAASPTGWRIAQWAERNLAFITFPISSVTDGTLFVFNTITQKWATVTNWAATCFESINGSLFFGAADGYVMQGESTGEDDGSSFTATFLSQFRAAEKFGQTKSAALASMHFRGSGTPHVKLFARTDGDISIPNQSSVTEGSTGSAEWDVGLWDEALWDELTSSAEYVFRQDVRASGETIALGAVIVSSGSYPLNIEARHGTVQISMGEPSA